MKENRIKRLYIVSKNLRWFDNYENVILQGVKCFFYPAKEEKRNKFLISKVFNMIDNNFRILVYILSKFSELI